MMRLRVAAAAKSRRVFSPRASESASSPEPSPVQWFKSIKAAASHCILQGLVKSCNASPLCAKSICCFATRSEKWKRRVNLLHYTGTPLTSKVFVWNNKASLIRACENVSQTYTGTLITAVVGLSGFAITHWVRHYDLKGADKRFAAIERRQRALKAYQAYMVTRFNRELNIVNQQMGKIQYEFCEMEKILQQLEKNNKK
ncbi:PREDICTED: uncharacterized protein LOC106294668 isoform X2 [Brassica oleracea var. oleracea]|uniref:uncharacterized protein LOC106294668 isoform X2 n=1 Tax=Brassica oleracea var. oleracea TaxID=109376 RepID=UPI0006A750F5|nr:PREDICTED: uncharacterized protein LOC106294668 isoform X2 [Brassica oleracea var. oleracea]